MVNPYRIFRLVGKKVILETRHWNVSMLLQKRKQTKREILKQRRPKWKSQKQRISKWKLQKHVLWFKTQLSQKSKLIFWKYKKNKKRNYKEDIFGNKTRNTKRFLARHNMQRCRAFKGVENCEIIFSSAFILLGALGVVSKSRKVSSANSENEKMFKHLSFQDMPEPQRFDHFFFLFWL